mmetsp:Transcript_16508/g.62781  ORF Transcript_16508/g.62781 Transcript_16508/m.62781 type:complete len:256 (-) Transcript_16508:2-769(-)
MTTAHRPTWKSAVAGGGGDYGNWSSGGQVSSQTSARDQPGQLKMKPRRIGQATVEEVKQMDLRARLDARERQFKEEKRRKAAGLLASGSADAKDDPLMLEDAIPKRNPLLLLRDDDEPDLESAQLFDDADEEVGFGGEDDSDLDDSDDSDDDEDDDEELRKELEKIRKERAEAKARQEAEEKEAEAALAASAPAFSASADNPLSKSGGGAKMKRKWNDDVVFRNQANDEPEIKKRFVNDPIRSDFHRRFIKRYVQ